MVQSRDGEGPNPWLHAADSTFNGTHCLRAKRVCLHAQGMHPKHQLVEAVRLVGWLLVLVKARGVQGLG